MFVRKYVAAMRFMSMAGTHRGLAWLLDVEMRSGRALKAWISSLSAFWPGLQAMSGAPPTRLTSRAPRKSPQHAMSHRTRRPSPRGGAAPQQLHRRGAVLRVRMRLQSGS